MPMAQRLREGSGALLLISALGVLLYAISRLRERDYLSCIILVLTGLSLLRAAVELLQPSVGE